MNNISLSLDNIPYNRKPSKDEIKSLSTKIGGSAKNIDVTSNSIATLCNQIGANGHSFCTSTFKDGKRDKEHFEQQQLFALDFDNKDPRKSVTFEQVKLRADKYDLPILFAYDTFSSVNHDKFRVVFLSDSSINDRKSAEAMQRAFGTVFPESDQACVGDVSRMFYGGKEVIYCDSNTKTFNVESLFRNMTSYLQDTCKEHYKRKLKEFSNHTHIAMNKNGLLDVRFTEKSHRITTGTQEDTENGKISPTAIIFTPNIIDHGEKLPNLRYVIKFSECTDKSSVSISDRKKDMRTKHRNHTEYRSAVISEMESVCKLFREFLSGERDFVHHELFGLMCNLINVETGRKLFIQTQHKYPELYDSERVGEWERQSDFACKQDYKPISCENFCPYCQQCQHGRNILSTAHPKRGMMEKLSENEEFATIEELQEQTFEAIREAYNSTDRKVHIVKSMTGAGKSTSYLKLISDNPDRRFLIAAPTNLLKDELYSKANDMEIKVIKTPSLEQIKTTIPQKIWDKIQLFYRTGQHRKIYTYISEMLKRKEISCLKRYIEDRKKLMTFKGSVITTHKYLLNMDAKMLNKYDAVIIDEDILFKCVLANQEELTVSELKKLRDDIADSRVEEKINDLLDAAEHRACVEVDGFEYEPSDGDEKYMIDLPAFCLAKRFYVRKDPDSDDVVMYIKPSVFKNTKYIVVSATADEAVYRAYFGKDRVEFSECQNAKYMGKLYQYPGKSMSRTCIDNNRGIVQRLIEKFNIDESRVITFMRENVGQLHFGNTEGSNLLEGKDILVIGTPYYPDYLYKLAAFTLGIEFDENEVMKPRIVTHNGYRFAFNTFENEDLRNVQFWMLESELEQAVGRARLLRHDCTVRLFSNFPVRQAEMIRDFDYN